MQCVENHGDTVSIGVFKYFFGVTSVVELKTSFFLSCSFLPTTDYIHMMVL